MYFLANKIKYFMQANSNYKETRLSKYEGQRSVTYPLYQHAPDRPVSSQSDNLLKQTPAHKITSLFNYIFPTH
jgi:hypothetical protein